MCTNLPFLQTPAQRPNSPNLVSNDQTLVDLTETLGGGGDSNKEAAATTTPGTTDSDLEKAIQLSLQEHNSRAGAPAFGGIKGVNQEDEDVSRALEASLLESANGKKRRAV